MYCVSQSNEISRLTTLLSLESRQFCTNVRCIACSAVLRVLAPSVNVSFLITDYDLIRFHVSCDFFFIFVSLRMKQCVFLAMYETNERRLHIDLQSCEMQSRVSR